MDLRLALISGIDIPLVECQIIIHQPTMKDIAFVGEEDFFTGLQTLCLKKEMFESGESLLEDMNNFQIFMTVISQKETYDKKLAVTKVLQLIFPEYKIIFTPQSLILNKAENSALIDEKNFESLQEILRKVFCLDNSSDQAVFNPQDEKAKEIAKKLMRGRERIAAEKNIGNPDVFGTYISTLSIGLHIPLTGFNNYTVYQIYDAIERYGLWVSWDLDIRTRLAGGTPDTHADNWMKPIH